MSFEYSPLFFIGAPRSGTTIIFEAVARHPDLAWISNYCSRFPNCPRMGFVQRIFGDRLGEKSRSGFAISKQVSPNSHRGLPGVGQPDHGIFFAEFFTVYDSV